MTHREPEPPSGLSVFLVVMLIIVSVLAIWVGAQHQDEIDQRAMEKAQTSQPAPESTEARLNAMVGYDEIKQK